MTIKEKLSNATNEQIERYWHSLFYFDCVGINCSDCLFRDDNRKCVILLVDSEKKLRGTAK